MASLDEIMSSGSLPTNATTDHSSVRGTLAHHGSMSSPANALAGNVLHHVVVFAQHHFSVLQAHYEITLKTDETYASR